MSSFSGSAPPHSAGEGEALLRRVTVEELISQRRDPVDAETRLKAEAIVNAVRAGGEEALLAAALKFGDLQVRYSIALCVHKLWSATTCTCIVSRHIMKSSSQIAKCAHGFSCMNLC